MAARHTTEPRKDKVSTYKKAQRKGTQVHLPRIPLRPLTHHRPRSAVPEKAASLQHNVPAASTNSTPSKLAEHAG